MQFYIRMVLLATLQVAGSLALNAPAQAPLGDPTGASFERIRKLFQKADIIEDVVDDFTPKCFVLPSYGDTLVSYGTHFNTSDTKDMPSVSLACPEHQPKGMTLILTDPDAPSRENPKWGEMCHWIATFSTKGMESLVEYKAPGPPAKTGYHRYVFILLEGDNENLKAPEDRQHWGADKAGHGVRDWAKSQNLKIIGGNFFFEKNEEQ